MNDERSPTTAHTVDPPFDSGVPLGSWHSACGGGYGGWDTSKKRYSRPEKTRDFLNGVCTNLANTPSTGGQKQLDFRTTLRPRWSATINPMLGTRLAKTAFSGFVERATQSVKRGRTWSQGTSRMLETKRFRATMICRGQQDAGGGSKETLTAAVQRAYGLVRALKSLRQQDRCRKFPFPSLFDRSTGFISCL